MSQHSEDVMLEGRAKVTHLKHILKAAVRIGVEASEAATDEELGMEGGEVKTKQVTSQLSVYVFSMSNEAHLRMKNDEGSVVSC